MSAAAPTYDLVLLLDPQAEDARRTKIVSDARSAIESEGELLRHDGWGERALAYPITRRSTTDYHLFQFHTSRPELLRSLDRTLRIADEVLRFRIVKLRPGTPPAPDMRGDGARAGTSEARGAPGPAGRSQARAPASTAGQDERDEGSSAPAQPSSGGEQGGAQESGSAAAEQQAGETATAERELETAGGEPA